MLQDSLSAAIAAYLEHCYEHESPPRVDELAQTLRVAPATLRRMCQTCYGQAPSILLKNAQAQRALDLLLTSKFSTTRIAYKAGFGSRRTLFRAFLRREGTTPDRVRRHLRRGSGAHDRSSS